MTVNTSFFKTTVEKNEKEVLTTIFSTTTDLKWFIRDVMIEVYKKNEVDLENTMNKYDELNQKINSLSLGKETLNMIILNKQDSLSGDKIKIQVVKETINLNI